MNILRNIHLTNGIGFHLTFIPSNGGWGIEIKSIDSTFVTQKTPIYIELYNDISDTEKFYSSYNNVREKDGKLEAVGTIKTSDQTSFRFKDIWSLEDSLISLSRKVTVKGNNNAGFLSGITLPINQNLTRNEYKIFAPGMIYGNSKGLSSNSIGGSSPLNYNTASDHCIKIREDRLPAPFYGLYFSSSQSLSILNPNPKGNSTAEDSHDQEIKTLIDERFQFGSIGSVQNDNLLQLVYSFPGSEGNITYRGNTYPEGQIKKWRNRYHPVKDGLIQKYKLIIKTDKIKSFSDFCRSSWRLTWNILSPELIKQDLTPIRTALLETLFSQIEYKHNSAGIPNYLDSMKDKEIHVRDPKAIMGFTGRNIESAYYFLKYARILQNTEANKYKKAAYLIINNFTNIKMSPPAAEGFNIDTGKPELALPLNNRIYLRSLGDGFQSIAKTYQLENKKGINNVKWLEWMSEFADWLLNQQYSSGGFPRAWEPITGKIIDKSPVSSYNAIPFLVSLYQITGNKTYLKSARKAGDFIWQNGQKNGFFIGGTIDNPNVLDKEACAISLKAYLALYEETKNYSWLKRAQTAGDFAETWIYIWNIPMPDNEKDKRLDWNRNTSTVGMQLISTGHSLVDAFMAYNAGDYLKLYYYTKDEHYKEVSNILLHNTKSMIQTNKNHLGFKCSGWQQEHWSFAPLRGIGMHRGWLPWVATSQLCGIYECEELYSTLSSKKNDNI